MQVSAYRRTVKEDFNPDVCRYDGKKVFIALPDGAETDFTVAKNETAADVVMLLRVWLQNHIDADRLARKDWIPCK